MKKVEIEHSIANKIRKAAEDAIVKAIGDLKNAGHAFKPLDDFLFEWAEPGSEETLQITCAIGVDLSKRPEGVPTVDPVTEWYIARAESGEDKEAAMLNLLEGDIANGGFIQLYDNKGEAFIQESIALLRKIGSKTAAGIVEQALTLFQEERVVLDDYDRFLNKIDKLDDRFWHLEESIPALLEGFRQKEGR